MSDLAIVIPCKDTSATLPRVLSEIPAALLPSVLIVDDGSSPPLAAPGVTILRHETNRGYGATQKTGYAEALRRGADRVVLLHGDGQYDTAATLALADLLDRPDHPGADAALGSRFLHDGGRTIPLWRRLGNRLLTDVANRRFHVHLSELHTGSRAFRADALRVLHLDRYSDDYAFDQQVLTSLLARGFRLAEAPCPVKYDASVQSISFRRSVKYGLGCLQAIAWPPG